MDRARMFENKTKDLDDPGMYALNKLAAAEDPTIRLSLASVKGYETFTGKTENIYGTKTNRSHLTPTDMFRKKNNWCFK